MDYKARIKEKGYLIKFVAKQCGMANITLCLFINGKYDLKGDKLTKLNEFLK